MIRAESGRSRYLICRTWRIWRTLRSSDDRRGICMRDTMKKGRYLERERRGISLSYRTKAIKLGDPPTSYQRHNNFDVKRAGVLRLDSRGISRTRSIGLHGGLRLVCRWMEIRRSRLHIHFAFHVEHIERSNGIDFDAFPKASVGLTAVLLQTDRWDGVDGGAGAFQDYIIDSWLYDRAKLKRRKKDGTNSYPDRQG